MQCVAADVNGVLLITQEAPPACAQYLVLAPADYEGLRMPFGGDPDFSVVLWSFAASLLLWGIGVSIGLVTATIRKAR